MTAPNPPTPIDLFAWIAERRDLLRPPVGNAQLWADTDFMVTVVGGPNQRTDFHDDPCEEFFFQLRGDMVLRTRQDDQIVDIPIREGDVLLLPPHVLHSPQRPVPGSVGLVVERTRPAGVVDGFEWFCGSCSRRLHRAEAELRSIVEDLPPLFASFYDDIAARTCATCGWVHPGRGALPEPPLDPAALPRQERVE